jgi:hypothetical protein
MFKRPVTALLTHQPPSICFQAANDVANLGALAFTISMETRLTPAPAAAAKQLAASKGNVIIEGVPQEDLERRLSVITGATT